MGLDFVLCVVRDQVLEVFGEWGGVGDSLVDVLVIEYFVVGTHVFVVSGHVVLLGG